MFLFEERGDVEDGKGGVWLGRKGGVVGVWIMVNWGWYWCEIWKPGYRERYVSCTIYHPCPWSDLDLFVQGSGVPIQRGSPRSRTMMSSCVHAH